MNAPDPKVDLISHLSFHLGKVEQQARELINALQRRKPTAVERALIERTLRTLNDDRIEAHTPNVQIEGRSQSVPSNAELGGYPQLLQEQEK
jgi:hypothetical protein